MKQTFVRLEDINDKCKECPFIVYRPCMINFLYVKSIDCFVFQQK